MTTIIPNRTNKTVTQTNRSKVLGDLWASFNLDLQSSLGAIRVGTRFKSHTTATGIAVGFRYFDGFTFTIAGSGAYKTTTQFDQTSPFIADASSGVPTFDNKYSDIELFNSTLVGTTTDELYSKVSNGSGTGAWTDRNSSLSSGNSHKLCYFQKRNRLYVTDLSSGGNAEIHSLDTSWTVATSGDYYIDLGAAKDVGQIATVKASSDRIWIGMRNGTSSARNPTNECSVFEWDGLSSQVTKEYKIKASEIRSMVIRNDVPVVMDSNGIMHEYGGYSFKEIGRLPVDVRGWLGNPDSTENGSNIGRFMHPNGLEVTPDNTILALISNRNTYKIGSVENVNENLPSGIWELGDNGFVHKHSLSYMPIASTTVTDYGQNRIFRVGGLSYVKYPYSIGDNGYGIQTLFCGSEMYTNATATETYIHTDAPYPIDNTVTTEGYKSGYFVTSWIFSDEIQDTWQKILLKHRKLLDAASSMLIKYRLSESAPVEISITWTSTTTFTTTTDVSAMVGYEVEVLQGTGSGRCVHISSVTGSGTYTVTVDEVVTGVTGTAKARIQAWEKTLSTSDQSTEYSLFSIDKSSVRIQIKCCLIFRGEDELFELDVISTINEPMV